MGVHDHNDGVARPPYAVWFKLATIIKFLKETTYANTHR